MNNKVSLLFGLFFIGVTLTLSFFINSFVTRCIINNKIEKLQETFVEEYAQQEDTPTEVIEKVITSSSLVWRDIQDRIADTVAQVFVQVAAIDLLQPYKTPMQGMVYGSGFFINEDGDFITNAHVVLQAKSVYIQIPSLGKRIIDMEVVGIAPERDIALLRLTKESKKEIEKVIGSIPYLELDNSDSVHRSDEVLALGYPLGQHSLKSTTGVVSGREKHLIQISAPINPGSSGGPLLNDRGKVIGINSAGIVEAQNVGYAVPINDLKIVYEDLKEVKVLRKPFLGVVYKNGTTALTEFLHNPQPGGTYIIEVVKDSILEKAGIQRGDMIYEIDGNKVDLFGEMNVSWTEDKISLIDYVSRLVIGDKVNLVLYRKGRRMEYTITFDLSELPKIRKIYPNYESYDYEVFGGMVVMELTVNHILLLGEQASGILRYGELKNQDDTVLVITHIFPNSQLHRARSVATGSTINEINGMKVKNLEEYRRAIRKGAGGKFFTILASDNISRASDSIFAVLLFDQILKDEPQNSRDFKYPLSSLTSELLRAREARSAIEAVS